MPNAPTSRLQVATRIHLLLLRELGQGVAVEQLLGGGRYARDVLLVCDALRGSELAELAAELRRLTATAPVAPAAATVARPDGLAAATAATGAAVRKQAPPEPAAPSPAAPGHAPQATDWSADTSGFGLPPALLPADPPDPGVDEPPRRSHWLQRWRQP